MFAFGFGYYSMMRIAMCNSYKETNTRVYSEVKLCLVQEDVYKGFYLHLTIKTRLKVFFRRRRGNGEGGREVTRRYARFRWKRGVSVIFDGYERRWEPWDSFFFWKMKPSLPLVTKTKYIVFPKVDWPTWLRDTIYLVSEFEFRCQSWRKKKHEFSSFHIISHIR